jgi:hypothetical protein
VTFICVLVPKGFVAGWLASIALNPTSVAPALKFVIPIFKVPVPVKVPFSVTAVELAPEPRVGLAPSGKLQLLFIIFVFAVWEIVTKLNATLLQLRVALVAPSKDTVPPFASKIADPEIVKLPESVIVPLGAVNVPPEMVSAPFKSAPLGNIKVPELTVVVLVTVNPV